MGKLFDKATQRDSLRVAWYRIRSNGQNSALPETRDAIHEFERKAESDIIRIQRALRDDKFTFIPQKGVLKAKSGGRFRGIVMAPVENRIIERALLDRLQQDVAFIREVIETPTCIGGVPDRSVPHGLALLREAFSSGKKYFIRSDISSFFDGVPRQKVLHTLQSHIDDQRFMTLLEQATTVTLQNEKQLGEDKKVFPTNEEGVAQGSPLSPLFGNILLNDFDRQFNERGIVCIRFLDDFIFLGEKEDHVRNAFNSAKVHLSKLGLNCHDPFATGTNREKAQYGLVDSGFTFLGFDIRPGLFQPSKGARTKLIKNIDRHLQRGCTAITAAMEGKNGAENTQRYAQTLRLVDSVIRGWGNAFAYGNAQNTISDLDGQIDRMLDDFRRWFANKIKDADSATRRRAGGVCLLSDIETKSLDELPYRLQGKKSFRQTSKTIKIYTDGSLLRADRFSTGKKGIGGWAAVFTNGREIKGSEAETTNNRMELVAVIEALKATSVGASVLIRTDSNYVVRTAEEGTIINKHKTLWDEFVALRQQRKVKLVWVKGHNKDPKNERADRLANEAAQALKNELSSAATTRKNAA
jgi:RNA-directed DNA polymerase